MQNTSRRSFLTILASLIPASLLAKTVEVKATAVNLLTGKTIPRNANLSGEIPVQSQTPDYAALRAQLNDYTSTFYGPHPCERCGVTIIKQAVEQGGVSYEPCGSLLKDDYVQNPTHYQIHHCFIPGFKNDKFYDLFVDNDGDLIDGNEIRPFLDWTPARPEQPRWAKIEYSSHHTISGMLLPQGKSKIITYLDSEIHPLDQRCWEGQSVPADGKTREAKFGMVGESFKFKSDWS